MRFSPFLIVVLTCVSLLPTHAQEKTEGSRVPREKQQVVQIVSRSMPAVFSVHAPNPGREETVAAGWFFDSRGYFLTCHHVVTDKKTFHIRMHDGSEKQAKTILVHPELDIAIGRIVETEKLVPTLPFGMRKDIFLGEHVVTIGSPCRYEGSIAVGFISSGIRDIQIPNGYLMKGLIQHSAPLNPGMSGGPVINFDNQVIGMNVALKQNAFHIGWAISTDTLIAFLSDNLTANFLAGIDHGLQVEEVEDATPAKKRSLVVKRSSQDSVKIGDEIMMIGNISVQNNLDIERAFWEASPREKLLAKIVRRGQELTVPVLPISTKRVPSGG